MGQRVQTIFRLVEFEPGRSLTMTSNGRLFGRVAVTYRADPVGEGRSRIVVKSALLAGRRDPGAAAARCCWCPATWR